MERPKISARIRLMHTLQRWGRHYFDLKRDKLASTEATEAIVSGVDFKGTNLWVLICAVFIASLGLNMNSTAVIIGAMLISPLMGPIMGIGLAVGVNDGLLLRRSAKNLFVATFFALLTSCLYFLISPISDARSELLARTQPTIYDVLIAFFGGFAGIIATGSRVKGNVIPGVAIATALMPPLCTSGYGLATQQWTFFFGAFYLFLINCVYIGVATWLGVRILKLPKHVTLSPRRQKLMVRWVTGILILVAVPSMVTTWRIVRQNIEEAKVHAFINREFGRLHDTQLLNYTYTNEDSLRTIEVSLIGSRLSQQSIDEITERMTQYKLSDVQLRVVQGGVNNIDENQLSSTIMQGVVKVTREQLDQQRNLTDSLRTVVQDYQARETEANELLPVLQALFPKVSHIAISHTLVTSVEEQTTTPSTIVIAYVSEALQPKERQDLHKWLVARKGTTALQLFVETDASLNTATE
jgi:uncharacterized hydrophobic protein (TIGR00271 family)